MFWAYVVAAYILAAGAVYAIYARIDDEPIRHPVWVGFLFLFVWPGVVTALVVVVIFALGLGVMEAVLEVLAPTKTVK